MSSALVTSPFRGGRTVIVSPKRDTVIKGAAAAAVVKTASDDQLDVDDDEDRTVRDPLIPTSFSGRPSLKDHELRLLSAQRRNNSSSKTATTEEVGGGVPQSTIRTIKHGGGDWGVVPLCVRDTLIRLLASGGGAAPSSHTSAPQSTTSLPVGPPIPLPSTANDDKTRVDDDHVYVGSAVGGRSGGGPVGVGGRPVGRAVTPTLVSSSHPHGPMVLTPRGHTEAIQLSKLLLATSRRQAPAQIQEGTWSSSTPRPGAISPNPRRMPTNTNTTNRHQEETSGMTQAAHNDDVSASNGRRMSPTVSRVLLRQRSPRLTATGEADPGGTSVVASRQRHVSPRLTSYASAPFATGASFLHDDEPPQEYVERHPYAKAPVDDGAVTELHRYRRNADAVAAAAAAAAGQPNELPPPPSSGSTEPIHDDYPTAATTQSPPKHPGQSSPSGRPGSLSRSPKRAGSPPQLEQPPWKPNNYCVAPIRTTYATEPFATSSSKAVLGGPQLPEAILTGRQPARGLGDAVKLRHAASLNIIQLFRNADQLQADMKGYLETQIHSAMRHDPRGGGAPQPVASAPHSKGASQPAFPTAEQVAALNEVNAAVQALRVASVELVATFLSDEEKRHYGLNSHKFQPRDAKSSSYQYTSKMVPTATVAAPAGGRRPARSHQATAATSPARSSAYLSFMKRVEGGDAAKGADGDRGTGAGYPQLNAAALMQHMSEAGCRPPSRLPSKILSSPLRRPTSPAAVASADDVLPMVPHSRASGSHYPPSLSSPLQQPTIDDPSSVPPAPADALRIGDAHSQLHTTSSPAAPKQPHTPSRSLSPNAPAGITYVKVVRPGASTSTVTTSVVGNNLSTPRRATAAGGVSSTTASIATGETPDASRNVSPVPLPLPPADIKKPTIPTANTPPHPHQHHHGSLPPPAALTAAEVATIVPGRPSFGDALSDRMKQASERSSTSGASLPVPQVRSRPTGVATAPKDSQDAATIPPPAMNDSGRNRSPLANGSAPPSAKPPPKSRPQPPPLVPDISSVRDQSDTSQSHHPQALQTSTEGQQLQPPVSTPSLPYKGMDSAIPMEPVVSSKQEPRPAVGVDSVPPPAARPFAALISASASSAPKSASSSPTGTGTGTQIQLGRGRLIQLEALRVRDSDEDSDD